MKRTLFTLASTLSLLLSLAAAAAWATSHARPPAGRLTLLAQVVDYDGTLRRVHASPPSLTVDLPGPARPRAEVFGRTPDSGPGADRLGFALRSDARVVDDGDEVGGPVSVRAWMATVPYWFVVLLGLPLPCLRLRATRRRGGGRRPQASGLPR